jgi:chromosomal replication initiator protein
MKLLQIKDQNAVIEIPNRFFKDWIEDNYPTLMPEIIGKIAGQNITIKYRTAEREDAAIRRQDMKIESRRTKLASRGIYLNPKYIFDTFVVGPSNQFAHAAAKRVVEQPGTSYNPLFLYGGVGLGKTHLINAIGNALFDNNPDIIAQYVSTERFISEVVSAIRHSKMDELKERYRSVDVILVDDIQFIANKNVVQEEFFHTFNALYQKQRQIVISSDRPPLEISDITDRLRSRFSMGLLADIQPAELETKVAIIYKKAAVERMHIPEEVAYFVATRVKSNIRELEGCLIKLGAHSSITGTKIDLAMTRTVLKDLITEEDKPVTVETIQKTVCEHFNLRLTDIKAKKRTKELVNTRQIAMYLARKHTNLSLSEIGAHFGGKDHATVIYACKQIEEKKARDDSLSRILEQISRRIPEQKYNK